MRDVIDIIVRSLSVLLAAHVAATIVIAGIVFVVWFFVWVMLCAASN